MDGCSFFSVYRFEHDFTGFYLVSTVSERFDVVLLGFTEFYLVLPSFT